MRSISEPYVPAAPVSEQPSTSAASPAYTGILPLALAREIQDGVQEFLRTSFRPSTPGFETLITDFTADPDNLFRGPYLGLDLPFNKVDTDAEFFPAVPLGRRAFMHQRQAFERLRGDVRQSTIVATGTGSGKTECFLLPILDWCRRHAGEPGIKAIVVYPMNALAEDQAKRLAALIWHNPLLKGQVRAGMYADREPKSPAAVMREDDVVRARKVMHRQPPDILLTNYKMLDNLLIRPDRQPLWAQNAPDTLRYLVVDELHTFDGAQGTDLACLIRRLKARLQMPPRSLCCIGTSATLGKQGDAQSIVAYARALFDEEFAPDAVVTENRQDLGQFLDEVQDEVVEDRIPSPDTARRLADRGHAQAPYARVRELYAAWFDETVSADVGTDVWRTRLGDRLSSHAFLVHLLTALDGRMQSLHELAVRIQSTVLPAWTLPDILDLVEGFVTLVAFARRYENKDDVQPFLTVRIHFWIRELTRMVVSIPAADATAERDAEEATPSAPARLLHARDLSLDHPETVLPVVHCRECGGMAWIALETLEGSGFDWDLDPIYSAYFARQPAARLTYLLPQQPAAGVLGGVRPVPGHVCRRCLRWQLEPSGQCQACGNPEWCRVWRARPKWIMDRTDPQRQKSACCAYCGSGTGTGIFGVSATSIASSLVSLLFASKANGDPKLLAFGDSVQDVAHKAGFVEARSFRTLLRQAVARWLGDQAGHVSYARLHAQLAVDTAQTCPNPAEYVGAMAHVDLLWLESIAALFESDSTVPRSAASDAPAPVPAIRPSDLKALNRRLVWETFSELTFRSQFGRTLENTGCVTLSLDADALGQVARKMKAEVGERLGTLFEETDERQCFHFLLGVLHRMLHDGAVRIDRQDLDPIGALAQLKGSWTAVLKSRGISHVYPHYGYHARKPLLPSLQGKDHFAALTDAGSSARWYPVWARKCLAGGEVLRTDRLADFYALIFSLLTRYGLTERVDAATQSPVWAIPADRVVVSLESACLECNRCRRRTHVRPAQAMLWTGMQCLNPSCHTGILLAGTDTAAAPVLKHQLLHGPLRRVNARDHTSLLEAERRRRIERQFIAGQHAWHPNLLSTTPTLELGVDIGDLSSVMLYAVPPSQANYVQRLGRAGRRGGNALGLTVVNARPHDLFFWADPPEMIQGAVAPPGLYLEAYAILRRQFCAFALERLITDTGQTRRFDAVSAVLTAVARHDAEAFPLNWIGFVERHGEALLADFQEMFDLSRQPGLFIRLAAHIRGEKGETTFRSRVLDCLAQVQTEFAQWEERIKHLDRAVKTLRDTRPPPKDQDTQIRALEHDRRAYRAIRRQTRRQDVLERLTNFGILPNYAFPEEGIKLRSVVSSQGVQGQWSSTPYEYVRAASSGLTELAPGARFYAEGHRVAVNEVDLKISEPEAWRFCPECPYMERSSETTARACPQCGSFQWRDVGQVHKMVRLVQVHAAATAQQARIGDEQEERTILRYARALYPAFDPREAQTAYLLPTLPQPFGFEFLPHVAFRDVNFGRRAEDGLLAVAGDDVTAEGFLLCDRCGRALSPRPRSDPPAPYVMGPETTPNWKEEHAPHCPVRRQDDDSSHRIRTFLYNTFRSEAVRVRLPIRSADDTQIESFTAALHLGMRLVFRGRVDHLRSFTMSLGEGSSIAHWLFLYDAVPGGTGYLDQLTKPEVFRQILQLALETMRECACNQDQEQDAEQRRDGCYRCLYHYRARMEKLSRDTAIRMIRDILAHWPELQAVDSIQTVDTDRVEESELELRFLSWLEHKVRQAGGQFQAAPVGPGKNGYLFQCGDQGDTTWEMEPQVDLDSGYSVAEPVRADFLLRPRRGPQALSRPIAVFLDGWRYHRDRIALDIRQRLTIRDSGKLLVWSLTWDDVVGEDLSRAVQAGWNPFKVLDISRLPVPNAVVRGLLHAAKDGSSADLLFRYLQQPVCTVWTATAGQLALSVLAQRIQSEKALQKIDDTHPITSAYSDGMPVRSFFGITEHEGSFLIVGASAKDLSPMVEAELRPFLYLHLTADDEIRNRFHWAGALRLFNLLQFLPRTYWLCSTATDPVPLPQVRPTVPLRADGWDEPVLYMAEAARPLAARLRDAGVPAPEVGWEVMQAEMVAAQLELAWPEPRVGILMDPLPAGLHRRLQADGWTLFTLAEAETQGTHLLSALFGDKSI